MKLTVLGSGTVIPDAERGSPGLALEVCERLIFVDLGSGSLYRAERAGISVNELDCILLTHLHPDHTGDLVPLLFAFQGVVAGRRKRLVIAGPPGTSSFFQGLEALYGKWIAPLSYPREVKEIAQGVLEFDSVKITVCPVVHGTPSIGYRIEDSTGKAIVYSGDTEFCESLVALAANAELLILECSFPEDKPVPGHLTPSTAGRLAHESKCQRLLLTHFYPACKGYDVKGQCARFYSGKILLAEDFMEVRV